MAPSAPPVDLAPFGLATGARELAALARRVTPSGTSFDGDVIFALCPDDPAPAAPDPAFLLRAEALACAALGDAIECAVRYAAGRDHVPGLADSHPNS